MCDKYYDDQMKWARVVACIGEKRDAYKVLVGKPEKDNWEHFRVGRSIILNGILKKWDGRTWIGFLWLRIRTCQAVVNTVLNVWVL